MTTQLAITIILGGISCLLYAYICSLWRKQSEMERRLERLEHPTRFDEVITHAKAAEKLGLGNLIYFTPEGARVLRTPEVVEKQPGIARST